MFTFNNRTPSALAELEGKIKSTLDMFRYSPSSDEGAKGILRNVLSCCVKRVRGYLRAFEKHLGDCIQACARDDEPDCECFISQMLPLCPSMSSHMYYSFAYTWVTV